MTTEKSLILQLARSLRLRDVHYPRSDTDSPPTCLDCDLQEVKHTGWGWMYKHAEDCSLKRLLEAAEDYLKEPAA